MKKHKFILIILSLIIWSHFVVYHVSQHLIFKKKTSINLYFIIICSYLFYRYEAMGIKRQKQVRKSLAFYKKNFGYSPPYYVLVDGTFCRAALKQKINIREQLPKYLEAEVNICTTQCILDECEAFGKNPFMNNYGVCICRVFTKALQHVQIKSYQVQLENTPLHNTQLRKQNFTQHTIALSQNTSTYMARN